MDARWLALGVVGASLLAGRGGSLLRRAPAKVDPSLLPHVTIVSARELPSHFAYNFDVTGELNRQFANPVVHVTKDNYPQQWDWIVEVADRVRRGERILAPIHFEESTTRDGRTTVLLVARVEVQGGTVDLGLKRFSEPNMASMNTRLSGYFDGRWDFTEIPFLRRKGSPLRRAPMARPRPRVAEFYNGFDFYDITGSLHAIETVVSAARTGRPLLIVTDTDHRAMAIANRFSALLGPLPEAAFEKNKEIYEASRIGKARPHRPYRSPHHTASFTGLFGGKKDHEVGELALANGGVVNLVDVDSMTRSNMQMLVAVYNGEATIRFDPSFALIASTHPKFKDRAVSLMPKDTLIVELNNMSADPGAHVHWPSTEEMYDMVERT